MPNYAVMTQARINRLKDLLEMLSEYLYEEKRMLEENGINATNDVSFEAMTYAYKVLRDELNYLLFELVSWPPKGNESFH